MEVITKEYKVFEFDELSEEARERAISDHIAFWLEIIPYEEATGNFKKAIDKAEKLRTPWFTGGYVYDYCKEEVIEEIKLNGYTFTADGKIFSK